MPERRRAAAEEEDEEVEDGPWIAASERDSIKSLTMNSREEKVSRVNAGPWAKIERRTGLGRGFRSGMLGWCFKMLTLACAFELCWC